MQLWWNERRAGTPGRSVVNHTLLDNADQMADRLRASRSGVEVEVSTFSRVMGASSGPVVGVAWDDPAITVEASGTPPPR